MSKMPEMSLKESPYSRHYNTLTKIGAWTVDKDQSVSLYALYKTVMSIIAFLGICSLVQDLYMVYGNFKKMTWNLCITAFFIGGLFKNVHNYTNNGIINNLRVKLHKDYLSRNSAEDLEIYTRAYKRFIKLDNSMYIGTSLTVTAWLVTKYLSYMWGPRELPIPLRIPFEINMEDNLIYTLLFIIFGFGGLAGLYLVLETELGMMSILIQIWREYKILLKDIPKLNLLYSDPTDADDYNSEEKQATLIQEINPFLKKIKTKVLLKKLLKRQEELIEYTKAFEYCYNFLFLLQFFFTMLIVVVCCIQCILDLDDLQIVSYQVGYMILLSFVMFLISWFAAEINTSCRDVGEAAYSTTWYRMNSDLRKDIWMMIMRAQNPPKITMGKFLAMDLHAFMLLMRNIYSCVTLYLQLD